MLAHVRARPEGRAVLLPVCLILVLIPESAPAGDEPPRHPSRSALETTPGCTCAAASRSNGWCDLHKVGYLASIPVRSELLFETLDAHGHDLDLSTFECEACRKAIATEGFCEEHRVGFVHGLAYFSRLTYELARGVPADPASLACPVCRRNSEGYGWCEEHGLGMLGPTAVRDRAAYERAVRAIEILKTAILEAERCERCAVAIVSDTDCPYHRIFYKDGKPVQAGDSEPTPAP